MEPIKTHEIQSDVLVIGGGFAGLFAAIKAKQHPVDVVLVDKATPGRSGISVFAAGIFPYWMPGDDTEANFREIVEASDFLVDQNYARTVVEETYDVFQDLVKWGVNFLRDAKGEIVRFPVLGMKSGWCSPYAGSPHLMWKIRTEAVNQGVSLFGRIMITELLTRDDQCFGAVGFNVVNGEFYVFRAKATILAAGTASFLRAPMGSAATGDACAMALRAGLELRGMEQMHGTVTPRGTGGMPGLHAMFGSGGKLVNSQGERFMKKYNQQLSERARRFETEKGIILEWREGRGPIYMDCTHLPPEKIQHIKTALPMVIAAIKGAQGKDIAYDKVEYQPTPSSVLHTGGIKISDINGTVNMKGLFVIGAAGDFCGGVESTYGSALAASGVQGRRAGDRAARYAAKNTSIHFPGFDLKGLQQKTYAPLARSDGVDANTLLSEILRTAGKYVNKIAKKERLETAMREIDQMKKELLPRLSAKDPHTLTKAHEASNMLLCLEAVANAQLFRKESRSALYREDYPAPDNRNWMKWVITKLVDGQINTYSEDIPIRDWAYKPIGYLGE